VSYIDMIPEHRTIRITTSYQIYDQLIFGAEAGEVSAIVPVDGLGRLRTKYVGKVRIQETWNNLLADCKREIARVPNLSPIFTTTSAIYMCCLVYFTQLEMPTGLLSSFAQKYGVDIQAFNQKVTTINLQLPLMDRIRYQLKKLFKAKPEFVVAVAFACVPFIRTWQKRLLISAATIAFYVTYKVKYLEAPNMPLDSSILTGSFFPASKSIFQVIKDKASILWVL